jgi:hypothetical protein
VPKLALLGVLLLACVSPAPGSHTTPTPTIAAVSPTPTATGPLVLTCEPTRSRDATGVITADGRYGVVGETFTFGEDMNGTFSLVRRGAIAGDRVALHFQQVGASAPATWVEYSASASDQQTPWGNTVFRVGWKPISFAGSCWKLVVDGEDTGLVLALGR